MKTIAEKKLSFEEGLVWAAVIGCFLTPVIGSSGGLRGEWFQTVLFMIVTFCWQAVLIGIIREKRHLLHLWWVSFLPVSLAQTSAGFNEFQTRVVFWGWIGLSGMVMWGLSAKDAMSSSTSPESQKRSRTFLITFVAILAFSIMWAGVGEPGLLDARAAQSFREISFRPTAPGIAFTSESEAKHQRMTHWLGQPDDIRIRFTTSNVATRWLVYVEAFSRRKGQWCHEKYVFNAFTKTIDQYEFQSLNMDDAAFDQKYGKDNHRI